jgi:hypothetical protein
MTFKLKENAERWLTEHNYRPRPDRRNWWDATDRAEVAILDYEHGIWAITFHECE